MIQYVSGDILKSKADAIAHGIAPSDDFKNGLALSLREQWPSMYKDFRHFCQSTHPKEGSVWSWKGAGGPTIINLFVQEPPSAPGERPGRASLSNINHALKALIKEAKEREIKSLALTRLATGVGGLKWADVKPLVEKHLAESDIKVYVYEEFHKDMSAKED